MLRRLGLALLWCGCFSDQGTASGEDAGSSGGETSSSSSATSTAMSSGSSTSTTTEGSGTSTETASGGSEGDTMGCPVGAVEGPDVFAGWEGPIVLVGTEGEALPPCPPSLGDDGEVGVGPSAQPCVCTCAPTCRFDERDSSSCVGPGGVAQGLLAPGCNDLGSTMFVDYYTASVGQAAGDCAAPTAVPSEPTWDATFRVCLAPVDAECVPRPPGAIGPCIRREGDRQCPLSTAEKHVVFSDPPVNCGGCDSCELAALNACAADSIVGYSEAGCSGDMTMAFPDCSPVAVASLDYVPPIPDCTPSRSMLGELMPITYCCV